MLIAMLIVSAIGEIVLAMILPNYTDDKMKQRMILGGYNVAIGIILLALVRFDLALLQAEGSYYVADVVREDTGFSGRVGVATDVVLSSRGTISFYANLAGAVEIGIGIISVLSAFYCMLKGEADGVKPAAAGRSESSAPTVKEITEDSFYCTECGTKLFSRLQNCPTCAKRAKEEKAAQESSGAKTATQTQEEKRKSVTLGENRAQSDGGWSCGRCGNVNIPAFRTCTQCGNRKDM